MTSTTTNPPGSVINVEVLILGGGPIGFWLAEQLRDKGYSVLLAEITAAGSGQASHAQWYLHRGGTYAGERVGTTRPHPGYARNLGPAADEWDARLTTAPLNAPHAIQVQRSEFAFYLRPLRRQWRTWCQREYARVGVVPAGPRAQAFLAGFVAETQEASVDPRPFFRYYTNQSAGHHIRISDNVRFLRGGNRITQVTVAWLSGPGLGTITPLDIAPRFLVLAAGENNDAFLQGPDLQLAPPAPLTSFHYIKEADILVIRSENTGQNVLPLQNFFIPERNNLFSVSRSCGSSGSKNYWLVTNAKSWSKGSSTYDFSEAMESIRTTLINELPTLFGPGGTIDFRSLWFRTCQGKMVMPAQGQNLSATVEHVQGFDDPENLLAMWPARATLTPHWSRQAMGQIEAFLTAEPPWGWPPLNMGTNGLNVAVPVWEEGYTPDTDPFRDHQTFWGN